MSNTNISNLNEVVILEQQNTPLVPIAGLTAKLLKSVASQKCCKHPINIS